MCKAMEDMRNEAKNEEKKEIAFRMKALGLPEEVIAKAVDVSIALIKQWFGVATA